MILFKSDNKGYDRIRRRIYGGVLVFTVVTCASLTAIPALRTLLFDRVHRLRTAAMGESQPVIIQMSEDDIPYPEEFMRQTTGVLVPRSTDELAQKRGIIINPDVPSITPPLLAISPETGRFTETEQDENDDSPRFLQGEIEQEAYEKTLAANEKLALMVQGDDRELSFKTWGAVLMDGGVYWVRVIFQTASGVDKEYIWQTDISSGKTVPLNYNARNF